MYASEQQDILLLLGVLKPQTIWDNGVNSYDHEEKIQTFMNPVLPRLIQQNILITKYSRTQKIMYHRGTLILTLQVNTVVTLYEVTTIHHTPFQVLFNLSKNPTKYYLLFLFWSWESWSTKWLSVCLRCLLSRWGCGMCTWMVWLQTEPGHCYFPSVYMWGKVSVNLLLQINTTFLAAFRAFYKTSLY